MEDWTLPTNGTGKRSKRRSSILKTHKSPENDTDQEIEQERCTRDTRRVSFAEVAVVKEFSVTTSSTEGESIVPSGRSLSSLDRDLRGLLTGEIQNDCLSAATLSDIENKNDNIFPAQVQHSKRTPLQPIAVLPEDYMSIVDKENIQSTIVVDTRYEETCVFDEGEDMALTSCYAPMSCEDETRGIAKPNKTHIFLGDNADMEMTAMCTTNINLYPDFNKTVVFHDANMDMEITGQVANLLTDPDASRNRLMDKFKAMASIRQLPANNTSLAKPNSSDPPAESTPINTVPEITCLQTIAATSSTPVIQVEESEPALKTEMLLLQMDDAVPSIEEARIQQNDDHTDAHLDLLKDATSVSVHPMPHVEYQQESDEVSIKMEKPYIPVGELNTNCNLQPHVEVTDSVNSRSSIEGIVNYGSIIDPPTSDFGAVGTKRKTSGRCKSLLNRFHVAKKLAQIDSVDENTAKAISFLRNVTESPAVQMQPLSENQSLTTVNVIPVIPEVSLSANRDLEEKLHLDTVPAVCEQNLVPIDTEVLASQESTKEQKCNEKEESFMNEELIADVNMELVEDYPSVFNSPSCEKIVPIASHVGPGNSSVEISKDCENCEIPAAGPDEEMCEEPEADKPSSCASDEDETIDPMEICNILDKFDEVEKVFERLIRETPVFEQLEEMEQTEIEIAEAKATYEKKFAEMKKLMEERDLVYAKKKCLENDVEERQKEIKLQKLIPRVNEFTPVEFTSEKFSASYMWDTLRICVTFSHKGKKKELVCSVTLIPNPEGLNKVDQLVKLVYNSVLDNIQHIKDKPYSWMCLRELQCTHVLSEISTVAARARILIDDIRNCWCFEEITIQERTVSVEFISPRNMVIFLLIFTILPDRLGDFMPAVMKVLVGHIQDEIIYKCIATVEEGPMYFRRVVKRVSAFLRSS